MSSRTTAVALAVSSLLALAGCSAGSDTEPAQDDNSVVIYSGRSEELVGDLIARFEAETGAQAEVRYGDTAELAAQLLEEGDNSPADVFFAQDAGALQAVENAELSAALPAATLDRVAKRYRSSAGKWVGTSGRARVLVYNTDKVKSPPDTVQALVDPEYRGKVGIAPTNASFQTFVTAMRISQGEQATREWLEALVANDVQKYENNLAIVEAVNAGQIDVGLVNHYYWFEKASEVGAENMVAQNAAFAPGDVGNLVNVAGVAVLNTGTDNPLSEEFAAFLLSDEAQQYFVDQTAEYPLVKSVEQRDDLPPLNKIEGPDITLAELSDLRGTQDLLMQVGLL